jgi:hypothetical protein
MKRETHFARGLPLLALTLLLAYPGGAAQRKVIDWLEIIPLGKPVPVPTRVSGKTRTYYALAKQAPVKVRVEGPTRMKVMFRLDLSPRNLAQQECRLGVAMDDGVERSYSVTTERSLQASSPGRADVVPSRRTDLYIEVPEGEHTFVFTLQEAHVGLGRIRFFVRPEAVGPRRVAVTPLDYVGWSLLRVGDRDYTYYQITPAKPLVIRLFGPATAEILTRLDFYPGLHGRQKYSVVVLENQGATLRRDFRVRKAPTAHYRDNPEIVPGALRQFSLEVPGGEHTYEVRVLDTEAKSLSVRVLTPGKRYVQAAE